MGQNNRNYDGRKQRFLAGVDALMNLAEPMHKEYSIFGAIYLVRTYLMTDAKIW